MRASKGRKAILVDDVEGKVRGKYEDESRKRKGLEEGRGEGEEGGGACARVRSSPVESGHLIIRRGEEGLKRLLNILPRPHVPLLPSLVFNEWIRMTVYAMHHPLHATA